MKYIRTKDGIYERIMVVRQVCDDKEVAVIRPDKIEFEPILKQADTIEELVDEFVALLFDDEIIYECPLGYYTEIFKARTHCLQSLIKSYNINMIGVRAIYGAIWTDKGLIYVAKMKGVLSNGEIDWELL